MSSYQHDRPDGVGEDTSYLDLGDGLDAINNILEEFQPDFQPDFSSQVFNSGAIDPQILQSTSDPDPEQVSLNPPTQQVQPYPQPQNFVSSHVVGDFSHGINYAQAAYKTPQPRFVEELSFPDSNSFNQSIPRLSNLARINVQDQNRGDSAYNTGYNSVQEPSSAISRFGGGFKYKNNILNQFEEPSVALRIIDDILGEFSDEITLRLNKAVNAASNTSRVPNFEIVNKQLAQHGQTNSSRPNTRSMQQNLARPITSSSYVYSSNYNNQQEAVPSRQTTSILQSRAVAPQQKRGPKSKRTERMESIDPVALYDTLPRQPDTWRIPRGQFGKGGTEFRYTACGELAPPAARFTTDQLGEYLESHPLHRSSTKDSGLTLWLQKVPADSAWRYPSRGVGDKCRWADCPTNAVRTGEFRVTFSEDWDYGPDFRANPFHNAGYMHLYCLERAFNVVQLWNTFNFEADVREFRGDKAPKMMALTRDGEDILNVLDAYMAQSEAQIEEFKNSISPEDSSEWFKHSLTRALTAWHVNEGKKNTRKQAQDRDGFDLSKHLGDLELQAKMSMLKKLRSASKKAGTGNGATSRKRKDYDDEDEEDPAPDGEGVDHDRQDDAEPVYKRPRTRAASQQPPSSMYGPTRRSDTSITTDMRETSLSSSQSQHTTTVRGSPSISSMTTDLTTRNRKTSSSSTLTPPENISTPSQRRSARFMGRSTLNMGDSDTIVVEVPQRSPTRSSPRLARMREEAAATASNAAQNSHPDLDAIFDDSDLFLPDDQLDFGYN